MPVDVFLSAGEASGDLQASLLVGALRRLRGGLTFAAVGGDKLAGAGADVWLDSVAQEWASMGHLRAYAKIPWLLTVMLGLARRLLRNPPRLLVCVDFGAFNLRMLEWLRFCGYRGKAVYYFPPGAWLDDPRQARKVARVATALTPLAHQAAFYKSLGLPVEFYGHPLAGSIATRAQRPPGEPPLVAVLPGSRRDEVSVHLPVLAAAAARLVRSRPARFVVIAASEGRRNELRAGWPRDCGGAEAVVRQETVRAMADADVAWVASGTAVLEAALLGVPQAAFYRLPEPAYKLALKKVPRIVRGPITLPNLVTGRRIIPELLQYEFEPERLAALTVDLLGDGAARAVQLEGYAELRRALGPEDALERIASSILRQATADGVAP